MLKKVLFSALIMTTLFSCSSDNNTATDPASGGTGGSTTTVAMITRIDGTIYEMPPQVGGNAADITGGIYGNTYFLLNGYKNISAGKAKIGSTVYTVKIAVPKSDLSVGTHNFTGTMVAGSYYADFNITGTVPAETVTTTGGYVNVTSYNSATKELKGNFSFTTNNGVDLTVNTHSLIGSFDYILQ